jgi:hypothetical protein
MITRKHFLTFLTTSAMTLALVTTSSLVEGKGKPVKQSLTVSLDTSSIEEGGSATATVTWSTSDAPVDLALISDAPTRASVTPATVDATKATFTITGLIPSSQTVTLTASAEGYQSGSANLTVTAPPPVQYLLHRFTLPTDYEGGSAFEPRVREVNDVGELVGYYNDVNVIGGEQPFYLDTDTLSPEATNLNDLEFDAEFPIPPGWYIDAALGINNLGDISCALALDGDPEQFRGGVIVLRPGLPGNQVSNPQMHLLPDGAPDGAWSGFHTYACSINDIGVVLGRGDTVTSYVYQMPLHGQETDGIMHIISGNFDAFDAHLSNPIGGGPSFVNAPIFEPYIGFNEFFTYNVGTHTAEALTDISGLDINGVHDFNDWGNFCGDLSNQKGKNKEQGFVYDTEVVPLSAMKHSSGLNNSGDVVGVTSGGRPVLDHPVLGSILIDDVIVALTPDEQAIWDNSGSGDNTVSNSHPTLSERGLSEFPVISGMMIRPGSSYSNFFDGYVLFPSR